MTATGLTGTPPVRQLSPNPAGSEDTDNGYLIRDGEHAILIGSGRAMPAIVVGRPAHARWDTCPCVALPAAVIIYSEARYESGPGAALQRRRRAGASSKRRRAAMRYDEIDHSWREAQLHNGTRDDQERDLGRYLVHLLVLIALLILFIVFVLPNIPPGLLPGFRPTYR